MHSFDLESIPATVVRLTVCSKSIHLLLNVAFKLNLFKKKDKFYIFIDYIT